ncbi:class I SAM-dependent methyltransferase [Thalassospira sp.]|uniref:class I SAM-dependent methyltransferase n=1 Tax=Thalassospira sp. TaxID=1912094 RepID=UPI00273711CD|nr:class I SAM-dependent methyltransferase [Thalassospira sp.]MDP2699545.1 class I SAM-dependent methyltransferase [Thalassospira sp.]
MTYPMTLDWKQKKVLDFFQTHITRGTLVFRVDGKHEIVLGDGNLPRAGITLPDWAGTLKMAISPDPGFGEVYMHGGFDMTSDELEDVIKVLRLNFEGGHSKSSFGPLIERIQALKFQIAQYTSVRAASRRVRHHYDIGNDLYTRFLDPDMQYSCAFWDDGALTLEEAQHRKMSLTTQRLKIDRPGLRVVDVGCGWGGLSRFIRRHSGAEVHGITLSTEQLAWAQDRKAELPAEFHQGLDYHLMDYRLYADANAGRYDRVVSVGMFEHVGRPQFRTYFNKIAQLLNDGGRAVIHTIIKPRPDFTSPWIDRYIFPGGYIPAAHEVLAAAEQAELRVEACHFHDGSNYARTLMAWRDRFRATIDQLDPQKYDNEFKRMWEFYLAGCINAFDAGDGGGGMRVGQFVFTKPGYRHT